MTAELRYHVPRSQVWENSRMKQRGNVHLHVTEVLKTRTILRLPGESLCGRNGWYERPPEADEKLCPVCVDRAERYGVVVCPIEGIPVCGPTADCAHIDHGCGTP